VGVLTGIYLAAVMVASLIAANRLHFLEPFAELRNWASRAAFGLAMTIPVFCFLRASPRVYVYSFFGWVAALSVAALYGVTLDWLPAARGWMNLVGVALLVHFGAMTRQPVQMFFAATLGWSLFVLAYAGMGAIFANLHLRFLAPFHMLVIGLLIYGLMAVAAWVSSLAFDSRPLPMAPSRRRSP
jgi:hypothetical protein